MFHQNVEKASGPGPEAMAAERYKREISPETASTR